MTPDHSYNFKECKFPPLIVNEARKNELTETQTNNILDLFYAELGRKNYGNLSEVLGVIFELGKTYERVLNAPHE